MENAQGSRSILRNVSYGFSTWILPIGLSFAVTPVLVRSLGHQDYGIYALVLGFIAYSFNFSIGRAITKYLAEFRANGETAKINEVISATIVINLAVGLAGVVTIFAISNWLVASVLNIEEISRHQTVLALRISAFVIFFLMVSQVFNAVIQGLHRFDVFSKIQNFTSFATLLGNLALALSGYGLLALLYWSLLITFISSVLSLVSAKRLLPEFGFGNGFSRETMKLVIGFSSGVIGYQIAANVLLLFERSWITSILGPETLTFYVVPMSLGIYLHSFVASLTMVIFPLASEFEKDPEKLQRLYRKATKIVCFLVFFLASTLIVERHNFLFLWMGAEFAERSSDLLILHTLSFGFAAITIVSFQFAEGLGFPRFNFLTMTMGLATAAPLMIALTGDYGSWGIGIGRLAGFFIIFLSIFYLERWFFKHLQVGFWLKTLGSLGAAALIAAAVQSQIVAMLGLTWLTFITAVFVAGVAYCSVLWLLGFVSEDEREMARALLGWR